MTTFPGAPRLMKGAIIGIDPFNPVSSMIPFQYNPEKLTRTLNPQFSGEGGDKSEALRLKGAPEETISLEVEIDATDQLEKGDARAAMTGILPQLAALEMLIYPKSAHVIASTAMLATGMMEVVPPAAPLTLFVWGPQRVLPVRITQFNINEEAFDPKLNPIRAKISLGLKVLSYNDLPMDDPGYALFLAHQVAKEAMATLGSMGNAMGLGLGNLNL